MTAIASGDMYGVLGLFLFIVVCFGFAWLDK